MCNGKTYFYILHMAPETTDVDNAGIAAIPASPQERSPVSAIPNFKSSLTKDEQNTVIAKFAAALTEQATPAVELAEKVAEPIADLTEKVAKPPVATTDLTKGPDAEPASLPLLPADMLKINADTLASLDLGKHINATLLLSTPELEQSIKDKLPTYSQDVLLPKLEKLKFTADQVEFLGKAIGDAVKATSNAQVLEKEVLTRNDRLDKEYELEREFGRTITADLKGDAATWIRTNGLPANFLETLSIKENISFFNSLRANSTAAGAALAQHYQQNPLNTTNHSKNFQGINAFYARRTGRKI